MQLTYRIGKYMETESIIVVAHGCKEEGMGREIANGHGVSLGDDKNGTR